MSQLLRTAKNAEVASNEQRQAIVRSRLNNILQWTSGVTATTKNINPGTSTVININFNSPNWEQEIAHFVNYDVFNAHATDTITFLNACFSHFDSIKIIPNNSTYTIELKSVSQIREIICDYYKNMGISIYENSSFVRNEFDTFTGISVGPNSSVNFWFPLDPFISFAGTCIKDEIKSLSFELSCTAEQSNAAKAGKLTKSSGTTNLWTQANILLKNIKYIRNFEIVQNPNMYIKLFASLPQNTPVRHVNWRVEERVLYTGSWMSGQTYNTKLSDIYKADKIQQVSWFVRPVASAYNDPECCKEYSGYEYLGWKWTQLNTGGDEKFLDMTDPRKLRDLEFQQYKNEFGALKQLPRVIMNDPLNLFTKYYLRMTQMLFDYLPLEQSHEVVRYTSSTTQDYDITVNATANVGPNCELVACVVIAEEFEWNRATGQLHLIQS